MPLTITRLDKDKAVCAVWVYLNAVRRLSYGNLLKKCFEVQDFGDKRVLRGPTYSTCRGPRDCAFLLIWWNIWILSLKPLGKGRAFVSGSEELRLKPGIWIELIAISLILMELQILRSCCTILVEVKSKFQKTYFNEYETNFVSAAAFGVQTSRCIWITK